MRKGPKLLLPHQQKKSKEAEAPPQLETREQVQHSLDRDRALGIRALRRQEETKARRADFELTRDKLYLVVELITILILLIVSVASFLTGRSELALGTLGGGVGLSGLIAILHRPSKHDLPSY